MVHFTAKAMNLYSTLAVARAYFVCSTEHRENRWKPARKTLYYVIVSEKVNYFEYFECVISIFQNTIKEIKLGKINHRRACGAF
jgi:hypothetical protein